MMETIIVYFVSELKISFPFKQTLFYEL